MLLWLLVQLQQLRHITRSRRSTLVLSHPEADQLTLDWGLKGTVMLDKNTGKRVDPDTFRTSGVG
jgi:hypothetical protein